VKKHLPNALTCGNLFCGCVGITAAFQNELPLSAYLIGIAAVLDFLDGFVARWLKAYSAIGKDLDSLADCVTFGVLPAVIVFQLMRKSMAGDEFGLIIYVLLPYTAFLLAVFSALRLAKFNVDTRQSDSFIGVPTPANAILIASLPLILLQYPAAAQLILNVYFLIGLTLLMSYLLVAEIPLFALKFKSYTFAGNRIKYFFLGLSVLLLLVLQVIAVPLIIALYIALSVFTKPSTS
jgi:CDP-diacylglycerol---serine O-phosphatidyltransferase